MFVGTIQCSTIYNYDNTTQPQKMPLLPSPWHNDLAMTSRFWRPFRPSYANRHASANRARTNLLGDAWKLVRVGRNGRQNIATSSNARPPGATPSLVLMIILTFISLIILVILSRGSTILLIYIRSGSPAILDTVIIVLWPRQWALSYVEKD